MDSLSQKSLYSFIDQIIVKNFLSRLFAGYIICFAIFSNLDYSHINPTNMGWPMGLTLIWIIGYLLEFHTKSSNFWKRLLNIKNSLAEERSIKHLLSNTVIGTLIGLVIYPAIAFFVVILSGYFSLNHDQIGALFLVFFGIVFCILLIKIVRKTDSI
ncbi:hypothetical protein N9954_03145 [Maribacter sp.]|nr:hypothetical protein [Maribacter sp.]